MLRSKWFVLLMFLIAAPALRAQETGLSVQRFQPAPGGSENFFHVEGADTLGHLRPSFGLYVNYARSPLVLFFSDDSTAELLAHQAQADLLAAIGLGKRFQLGLVLPYTFSQAAGEYDPVENTSTFTVPQVASTALGDIRLVPKVQLVAGRSSGLSLTAILSLPTGSNADYQGEAGLAAEGRLVYELHPGERFRLGANLGYLFRTAEQGIYTLKAGNELTYALSASFGLKPEKVELIGELFGRAGSYPERGYVPNTLPLELLAGLRLHLGKSHTIDLGGGPGLTIGYGTPTWRALLGYAFTPPRVTAPKDTDGDGLVDPKDGCPKEPEDKDGFQDDDGCPDPDNDGDGILDANDRCPDKAEDKDNFQDEDGCPDPDNDGDGVLDPSDRCPTELEDRDNFQDDDGCPDPDNDNDGLPDATDKCPNAPEDFDKLGDEDGCPEDDFDSDGVADKVDQCPKKPETINGVKDEDGCPDEGKSQVQVTETKILILDKVYFKTDSAELDEKRSKKILDQMALTLKANMQLTKVAIEGHTDAQADDDYNIKLSQARTESVKKYLVGQGVDEARLEPKGYGESKPIADNKTEAGRAKNRRVEFRILEVNGQPVPETPPAPAPGAAPAPAPGAAPAPAPKK